MVVIVGHTSALEHWRTVGPAFLGSARQRRTATSRARRILTSSEKPQLQGGSLRPAGCHLPLHVLIGPNAPRTRTGSITSHTWNHNAPDTAFVAAGTEFLIASPELCFLQLASTLSLEKLILLGYELCGTYALQTNASATQRSSPLSTVAKLSAFATSMLCFPGRKKALRAVRYVLNGSASPMETALSMMLSLPHALGGYGISAPLLNSRIDVPHSMRNRVDRSYCRPDLYWPEHRLCLEYDSALYHQNPEQQESDARRRNSLITLGYTVLTVSPHQVTDPALFNRLAKQIADLLGKRLRYTDPAFTRAHLHLRASLFSDH